MTLTKEFVPLTQTTSMRAFRQNHFADENSGEQVQENAESSKSKIGKKNKQHQLFHQNGRK